MSRLDSNLNMKAMFTLKDVMKKSGVFFLSRESKTVMLPSKDIFAVRTLNTT